MKILVAGGAGYIGSALVPELLRLGHDVTVIDLLWFGNHLPAEAKVIKKDLFHCREEDFKGFDAFIFLAGLSNDPMAEFDPAKNFIYNGSLPSYLAYLAKRAGVKRFIYASSCSVYGYTTNELFDEEGPVVSNYPYGISKLQGERGVLQLHDKDFSVIALRQGTVSGYGPRMRIDLIVNAMFTSCMLKKQITINNPEIWRPIYDLRDAVHAYVKALEAGLEVSGVFNVASDNYTVGQVANIVKPVMEELLGEPIKLEIKNIPDMRNYKVSTEKARKHLGFSPRYKIEDTVRDLYQHKDDLGDLDNDEYYNIRVFRRLLAPDKVV